MSTLDHILCIIILPVAAGRAEVDGRSSDTGADGGGVGAAALITLAHSPVSLTTACWALLWLKNPRALNLGKV